MAGDRKGAVMADRLYDTEERQERIILVGVETAEDDDTRQSL